MAARACSVRAHVPRFEVELARDGAAIAQARHFRDQVIERDTGRIVGSCRVLSPRDALRAGGHQADRDFDTALLIVLRDRMVEVDKPRVRPHAGP
jgi:putative hemolysin